MWRIFWALLLTGCASAPSIDALATLARKVRAALPSGECGVYFRDLRDGETLEIRGEEIFAADGAVQLLVLVKIYRDIADGRYRMENERVLEKTFPSSAPKDPKPFEVEPSPEFAPWVGKKVTIRWLVELMIGRSDRLATNNLITQVGGPEAITACMRGMGMTRSSVTGYLGDRQASEEGTANPGVPREYGKLLETLWRGEVVSREASAEMVALLSKSKEEGRCMGMASPSKGHPYVFVACSREEKGQLSAATHLLREYAVAK